MDIVHVRGVISLGCNGVFPEAPLPNAPFMAFDSDRGKILGF